MFEKEPNQNCIETMTYNDQLEEATPESRDAAKLDRRVLLKLDLVLQPILFITFVFLLLDRANVGNARIAGLQKDLRLTDHQYQICEYAVFVLSQAR